MRRDRGQRTEKGPAYPAYDQRMVQSQSACDSYWLYVVWDPLDNPDSELVRIQNPAKKLDHVKREVVMARFFKIPAAAIETLEGN